jgi:hypothetical protein
MNYETIIWHNYGNLDHFKGNIDTHTHIHTHTQLLDYNYLYNFSMVAKD